MWLVNFDETYWGGGGGGGGGGGYREQKQQKWLFLVGEKKGCVWKKLKFWEIKIFWCLVFEIHVTKFWWVNR